MNHGRIAPRTRRRGFSLVELMVVIALVVLLISMLLPALGAAKRMTLRMSCQSNLRALGSGSLAFSFDYGDRVPRGMNHWDQGDYTIANYEQYIRGRGHGKKTANSLASKHGSSAGHYPSYHSGVRLDPMGTLAALHYVREVNTFYCPDQDRNPDSWGGNYRSLDRHPNIWERLVDGNPGMSLHPHSNLPAVYAGYTHYFYSFPGPTDPLMEVRDASSPHPMDFPLSASHPYAHGRLKGMGFGDIAMDHQRDGDTPLILSCAYRRKIVPHFEDAVGRVNGLNGAMYDGSVRWIPHAEAMRVTAESPHLSNTWVSDPNFIQELMLNAAHKGTHYSDPHSPFEYIARNGLRVGG
jgi:prepilin-type N-terminal cleavage/methylation domain-containing protein